MKINSKNAISHFFPNPCFEQVYFEAVANAIYAGATQISILIKIKAFDQADTLSLTITDNGSGFVDKNFEKYSSLLEVDNPEQKGLGRLIFLEYFDEVQITSRYCGTKQRIFIFNTDFDGESDVTDVEDGPSGTTLTFKRFSGERVKSYDYLRPVHIKKALIDHFFPLLFSRKENDQPLHIDIELQTDTPSKEYDFFPDLQGLSLSDVPELTHATVTDNEVDFFQAIGINYSITNDRTRPKSIVTAICVDGRTVPYDLVSPESIPGGYQALFLFTSEYFRGKTDTSRQRLDLPDTVSAQTLKRVLRREMDLIITAEIPVVREENEKTTQELDAVYPHLSGYFPNDSVGLIVKNEAVDIAQDRFFADQKAILECQELDDVTYEKALGVSARVLMEYILYRTRIIAKLKSMDIANSEGEIHDLIVPRRKTLKPAAFSNDIFNNNVWMLDDKYMSYSTILSDEAMSTVVTEIALEDETDDSRPDITLVFSANPATAPKVDVVVVELKKHGLKLAKNEEVVSQLRQRARKLLRHFPDKINRIWFYGITDIDQDFRVSLIEDEFKEIFSNGTMFYKSQPIIVDNKEDKFPVDLYVMTYDTFIKDAESRNSTFLRILKDSVQKAAANSNAKQASNSEKGK